MAYLFLHPPRTGGSSIRRSWDLSPEEYKSHEIPDPAAKAPGDFWYGFTRNPFDRVVSLYHFPPSAPEPDAPFEEFVATRGLTHRHRWSLPVEVMTAPTYDWLKHADWVGRFEHRREDLLKLCRLVKRYMPEMHTGPSRRDPWPDYYDQPLRNCVRDWFEIDFQAFSY